MWLKGSFGNVLSLDSTRITADTRFNVLSSFQSEKHNLDLRIEKVRISDENEYSCEMSSMHDSVILNLIHLQVTSNLFC
jgi:hypothetical protein